MRRQSYDLLNAVLPDDLVVEILRHVESKPSRDAVALVCRRWHRLERLSRHTIHIVPCTEDFVHLLNSRFPNIRCLLLDYSGKPVRYGETGVVSHQSLSDFGLAAVGDLFVKLEKLSLIGCSNLTSVGLTSFAEKCRSLKSLDLLCCRDIGDEGLFAIGECCNCLEDLNLWLCERVTDMGLVQLVLDCGRTLKSLGVEACGGITNLSLQAVGSHCIYLESLSLESIFINDEGLLAVAKGCHRLKVLKLRRVNITDVFWQAVGIFCSLLELLSLRSLSRFTDMSLHAIGKGCKRLRNLTLSNCFSISNKGLDYVAAGCPELMHIEVDGINKDVGTDDGLNSIGIFCVSWILHCETLLLNSWKAESNALSKTGGACKFLQVLHLINCSSIRDDSIISIARACKNLKKLHIHQCDEVGDKGIIAVGRNCKFLTDLSPVFLIFSMFCWMLGRISDAGIIAIAKGCPQLSSLNVSGLRILGDKAMMELGEGCPLLTHIAISHCPKISDKGLCYLASKCALLESCHFEAVGLPCLSQFVQNMKKLRGKISADTKR